MPNSNTDRLELHEPAELEAIFSKVRAKLLVFFKGRGCDAEAEDLADEVIVRAISRIASRSEMEDPFYLCLAIANNVMLEHMREKTTLAAHVDQSTSGPASVSISSEEDRLTAALNALSAEDRQLILWYYGEDREERFQLAEKLGVSQNALRVRVHRIRARLLALLDTREAQ